MSLEVYQSRFQTQLRDRITTQQFYWVADNAIDLHPWQLAREIQNNVFIDTNWVLWLLYMLTDKCFLRRFTTWRRLPTYGPGYSVRYASDLFRGLAPGQFSENLTTANIRWNYAGNVHGKAQNRIGPLQAGAENSTSWSTFFQGASSAFIAEHSSPRVSDSGVSFQGAALTTSGFAIPITGGQLSWPPGRQKNRRLTF
jgi:hypothetical protein